MGGWVGMSREFEGVFFRYDRSEASTYTSEGWIRARSVAGSACPTRVVAKSRGAGVRRMTVGVCLARVVTETRGWCRARAHCGAVPASPVRSLGSSSCIITVMGVNDDADDVSISELRGERPPAARWTLPGSMQRDKHNSHISAHSGCTRKSRSGNVARKQGSLRSG